MDSVPGAETQWLVDSPLWECDNVTLPVSCHGDLADGGRSCSEGCRKLKLNSGGNW
jgi:hypothetical protein